MKSSYKAKSGSSSRKKRTANRNQFKFSIPRGYATSDTYSALAPSSTTVFQGSLLQGLLGSAGTLQAYPQHATPVGYGVGNLRLCSRLRLHYMDLHIRVIGSQSSTLVAGDLFNTIRCVVYKSGESFQGTVQRVLNDLDTGLDNRDMEVEYCDKMIALPSQAFDTLTNYNVPDVKSFKFQIPLNFDLIAWSTTASGVGSAWDTKMFDIVLEHVSDSSVTPNPQISYLARTFFTFR